MQEDIIKKISSGTTEIINIEILKEKLLRSQKNKKPLHIKAGFDPTAPDLHLGHVVLLRKIRQFQDLGHKVFFLIGDFTAQIGDPTGRDQLRVRMTPGQIRKNAKTYERQVFKILDKKKTNVIFNSKWLKRLSSQDVLDLSARCTVAQMLARADFKKRIDENKEISILEFIYPLMQGYDSVYLKADVELGGSDQKFNLLMARQLQETFGQEPQAVVMMPLLEGTDGVQKMSKSLGNYIGIDEPPKEIFGKIMSISDEMMLRYYELLTDIDISKAKEMHPKEAKLTLAEEIVSQFYSEKVAKIERESFEKQFSGGEVPDDIPEYDTSEISALTAISTTASTVSVSPCPISSNEVRRLLKQGAVSFNGKKLDKDILPKESGVLKIGKRRFLRLIKTS
ncbi:MAG: tyrosine--tRNA ligase [Candidatus Aceula lacicola]|nr:tyrosine--tRNA ligase [Candidatus Aceula lacicola]